MLVYFRAVSVHKYTHSSTDLRIHFPTDVSVGGQQQKMIEMNDRIWELNGCTE